MPIDLGLIGNEFFTNVILPFVLVFTVVFAILEKTEAASKKRDINAIISLVIGLIVIGVPAAIGTIQKFIPIIAVLLVILFAWMLVFGFVGEKVKVTWSSGLQKFFLVSLGLVLLAAIMWAVASSTGLFDMVNVDKVISAQITQTILFIGAIVAVVAIVVSSTEEHPAKSSGGEKT